MSSRFFFKLLFLLVDAISYRLTYPKHVDMLTYILTQGCLFLFLGVIFLFDSAMLALGDILFLTGLTMTIGT